MVGSIETVERWQKDRPRKKKLGERQMNKLKRLALEDETDQQMNLDSRVDRRETTLARATRVLRGG